MNWIIWNSIQFNSIKALNQWREQTACSVQSDQLSDAAYQYNICCEFIKEHNVC